jgi:ribonuclease VapC
LSKYVLDASAVLAVLNNETGSDIVQKALPDAVISTVNLAEVVTRLTARNMPEGEIREVLSLLGIESVPFTDETALRCGVLFSETKSAGLSIGDRACLALAKEMKAAAITADRSWQSLDIGTGVRLIR